MSIEYERWDSLTLLRYTVPGESRRSDQPVLVTGKTHNNESKSPHLSVGFLIHLRFFIRGNADLPPMK